MAIKTIPLSRLEMDLKKTLNECADTGETVVVEMPDQRLFAIQLLDPGEDDSLMDELLATNPKFQALVAKSKAGPRNAKPPLQALVAYCYYSLIYEKSPVGLPVPAVLANANESEKLNRLLQEIAWDAMTTHPLSGVKAGK